MTASWHSTRDVVCAVLLVLLLTGAGPDERGPWRAGGYAFSDERGGFRIVSVRGTGTKGDPIEITQTLTSAGPATLVIRAVKPIPNRLHPYPDEDYATGFIHLRIVATNGSGLAWTAFILELQETPGRPSGHYDGLSFDQNGRNPQYLASDRFSHIEAQYTKGDRLWFSGGHVDPGGRATFGFYITDITPAATFYLVEDPSIPMS